MNPGLYSTHCIWLSASPLDSDGNRMIAIFVVVQIYQIILLHLTYKKVSFYLYGGFMFATILIPLVWMIVARILLGFIEIMNDNQLLIKTIQKILQVFPEGIIIQTLDEKSQKLVLQFINNAAAKEILSYDDALNKPIDDGKLNYFINEIHNLSWTHSCPNDQINTEFQKLSDYLNLQIEALQEKGVEVASSIELRENNDSEDESIHKFYNVNTMQVDWNDNKNSFIHVFANTTSLKNFEMEKARNECLQLMFSSVSHEFRTPINAFSNSIQLVELNYNNLI